jgi:hypothetical protein
VKAERIILTPTERAELLRLGGELDHQVGELLQVVKPDRRADAFSADAALQHKGVPVCCPVRAKARAGTESMPLDVAFSPVSRGRRQENARGAAAPDSRSRRSLSVCPFALSRRTAATSA